MAAKGRKRKKKASRLKRLIITLIVLMWPGFKNALPLAASAAVSAVASFWLASHWCVLLGTLTGLALAALLPGNQDSGSTSIEDGHHAG